MTIIVYEDGALYSDRALISTEAGIYTNNYSKKLIVRIDRRFALAVAGDELPQPTENALMQLVEDFLTLVYAMEPTDPYPQASRLAEIMQTRGIIVMTRDRAFHLKRKSGPTIKKPEVVVIEAGPGQRFVGGNCGPFYLAERAMGTPVYEAIENAVSWKMGKKTVIDLITADELEPFVLAAGEGEAS